MEDIKWHVERREVKDLINYRTNPRKFTEKGLKDLEKSIDRLGYAQFVNINTDNVILSGHARVKIMRDRGIDELDVLVPNRPLNDDEAAEMIIRMNKNIAGKDDIDILFNEFDVDKLLEFGYEEYELQVGDVFEPEGNEEDNRLDKKKKIKCPECGYEF